MLVLISLLFMTGGALARPLATAIGTAFTYEDQLEDGGLVADGVYDFLFKVWGAETSGGHIGACRKGEHFG